MIKALVKFVMLFLIFSSSHNVYALSVNVEYTSTLSSGIWNYEFKVTNDIGNDGYYLYNFGFYLPAYFDTYNFNFDVEHVPDKWEFFNLNNNDVQFVDSNWATPSEPVGISSGSSVSGFRMSMNDLFDGNNPDNFRIEYFAKFYKFDNGILNPITPVINGIANPTQATPEPSTLLLIGAGLIGMARYARKQK